MTDTKLYALLDLIEEINKVEGMIELHKKNNDSSVMLSQYNAKKLKLTSYLISELIAPAEKSNHSMIVIRNVLDKFYRNTFENTNINDENSKRLERLISVL
jgi:hypothetical protein